MDLEDQFHDIFLNNAVGAGSISIAGSADAATISTFVVQGDAKIELSDSQIAKLTKAISTSLPAPRHNLPPRDRFFEGRDEQLSELVRSLAETRSGHASISALRGIGGIGKTELAVQAAMRLMPIFPDAQILIELQGTSDQPLTTRDAMADVIRRFHPTGQLPEDDAAVTEIYRQVLREVRAVVILDNARDTDQVAALLPPAPSCGIVTSRNVLHLPGALGLQIDCLDRVASIEVLGGHLAVRSLTEASLDALAEACRDHPLSLHVAGSYLAGAAMGVEAFCQRIEANRGALKIQGVDNTDVMAVLDLSVQLVAGEDAALVERWRDLSVFPAGFDRAAVAAVWTEDDGSAEDVDGALTTLHRYGLLDWTAATDRFHLHDVMRDVAVSGQDDGRFRLATLRHAQYFLYLLARADDIYLEGGAENTVAGLARYDLEARNISAGRRAVVGLMAQFPRVAELVSRYPDAGVFVLSLRQHRRAGIVWFEDAVEASRALKDRRDEGNHLGNLGIAYKDLGEMDKAIEHQTAALVISREIGDRRGEGNDLGNLGTAYAILGEMDKAIEHYTAALVISREIGDRRGEGNRLGNLGIAYARLGEMDKAIEHHTAALVIAREIGDRRGEGNHLGNLGIAYASLGEMDKAIEHHTAALVISREIGDRHGEGNHLGNLGIAYKDLGEMDKAIEHDTAALVISREIGDRHGEGNRLGNLGVAYASLGEMDKAIEHLTAALVIAREIGDRRGKGYQLGNLGNAYIKLRETDKAIEFLRAALIIFEDIGNPNAEKVRGAIAQLTSQKENTRG